MDSPLKHHFDPAERPDCLDVSPERLNPMTAAQLERELEAALEAMTEAEYDPAVIDAYLDALDRKAHTAPGRRGGGPADHVSVQLHGRGPGVRRGCVRRHRPLDGQRVQLRRAARGGCVRLCPGRRPGGAGQSNRQEGCPGRISRNI